MFIIRISISVVCIGKDDIETQTLFPECDQDSRYLEFVYGRSFNGVEQPEAASFWIAHSTYSMFSSSTVKCKMELAGILEALSWTLQW